MPLMRGFNLWVLAAVAMLATVPQRAAAIPACTAADIVQADPGCPVGTGTCTITGVYEIGELCTLNFGNRDVVIEANAELDLGSNSVGIEARSLTIRPRGTIAGSGDIGPILCIETTGNLLIERGVGRGVIDLSAADLAGCLDLIVGGSMTVHGEILGNQTGSGGTGGEITAAIDGSLTIGPLGGISATGGGDDSTGGNVDILADTGIQMSGTINVTGAEGGTVTLSSGVNLTSGAIDAHANRGANIGGAVTLEADRSLTIAGNINVVASGPEELSGACGGSVEAEAFFGDLNIGARLSADGSSPDGSGGCISLTAAGNLIVQTGGVLSVGTLGIDGCGGTMALDAGIDLIHGGSIDLSGGFGGGVLDFNAGRLGNVSGDIDATGRDAGSIGGSVSIASAPNPAGEVRVSGLVDVSGGRCSFDNGCGAGGCVDLIGCVVSIQTGARVFSTAPDGGAIAMTARKTMTIAGRVDATTNAPSQGDSGSNTLIFPPGVPPVTTESTITPPAFLQPRIPCTKVDQAMCLLPCPTCGNGAVEFPETCDLGNPIPVNCNGCSSSCQTQVCDDQLVCTTDMCDPRLGCFAVPPATPCLEPTNTPTITPTPTITATPTITGTPTQTGTPTLTGTPTDTATITPTPVDSHTPTATATPVSGRPGDANCDGVIDTADRLAIEAAIFAGTSCAGADVNIDGTISAADPASFVHASPQ